MAAGTLIPPSQVVPFPHRRRPAQPPRECLAKLGPLSGEHMEVGLTNSRDEIARDCTRCEEDYCVVSYSQRVKSGEDHLKSIAEEIIQFLAFDL